MPIFTVPIHESNDCHSPSGSSAGGQFCSDTGTRTGEIWRIPKAQYANPDGITYDPDNDGPDSPYRTYQRRSKAWERAGMVAIATGQISPEAAGELAGSQYVFKPQTPKGIWEPLPETLYHVTVNRDAVMTNGLKTKDERGPTTRGEGLGGGDSGAISFTSDKAYSGVIYEAFLALHDVATGKTTTEDLIRGAKEGSAGSGPFLADFQKSVAGVYGDFDAWRKGLKHTSSMAIAAKDIPAGSTPDGEGWMGRDEQFHHGYYTPMTPTERRAANTQVFNAWLTWRQNAGGPENPWFTFNDAEALAKIPREQIAVLQVKTKPGSLGWFQSHAEREWRVPTGKVIGKTTVLRTKNRTWKD